MAVRIDSYVAAGGNQRPAAGVLIHDALARRLGQVQPGSENLLAVDHGIHVPDEIAVRQLELLRGRRDTHLQAQRLADRPGRLHQPGHQRVTAHGQAAFVAAQGAPHLLAHQRGIEIVVARHARGAIGLVADLLEEVTRTVESALVEILDAGFDQWLRQGHGGRHRLAGYVPQGRRIRVALRRRHGRGHGNARRGRLIPDAREQMPIGQHRLQRAIDIQARFQPQAAQRIERAAGGLHLVLADAQRVGPSPVARGILAIAQVPVGQRHPLARGQHRLHLGVERQRRAAPAGLEIVPALHQYGMGLRAPIRPQRRRQRARQQRAPGRGRRQLDAVHGLLILLAQGLRPGRLVIAQARQRRGVIADDAIERSGFRIQTGQPVRAVARRQDLAHLALRLAICLGGARLGPRRLVFAQRLPVIGQRLAGGGRVRTPIRQRQLGLGGHGRRLRRRRTHVAQIEILQRIGGPIRIRIVKAPDGFPAVFAHQIVEQLVQRAE
ncbi:Uncharacterised protein [Bordetella pertussis]|nr:Uncharacterised protein [Bordetella pertussis]